MALYDFQQSVIPVTAVAGASGVKLFNARNGRVSLIITSDASLPNTVHVSVASAKDGNKIWYDQVPGINMKLVYRDFGPVIQQEVWIFTNSSVTINVYGTETFLVPEVQ